jgi:hypothetical protein
MVLVVLRLIGILEAFEHHPTTPTTILMVLVRAVAQLSFGESDYPYPTD